MIQVTNDFPGIAELNSSSHALIIIFAYARETHKQTPSLPNRFKKSFIGINVSIWMYLFEGTKIITSFPLAPNKLLQRLDCHAAGAKSQTQRDRPNKPKRHMTDNDESKIER